jgi:hypothetical protein
LSAQSLFEPRAGSAVQRCPGGARQDSVRHLPDEDVAEDVAVGTARPDKVALRQTRASVLDSRDVIRTQEVCHARRPELPSKHRSHPDGLALVLRQKVEARENRGLDCVGQSSQRLSDLDRISE